MNTSATISPCGLYRYNLVREWDASLPRVLFIMLNPSTADEIRDDPTIRRCIGLAKNWGYGSIEVCNLFAYRATNPREIVDIEMLRINRNIGKRCKCRSEASPAYAFSKRRERLHFFLQQPENNNTHIRWLDGSNPFAPANQNKSVSSEWIQC